MPPARQSIVVAIALSLLLGGCLGSVVEGPSPRPVAVATPTTPASAEAVRPTIVPTPPPAPTESADVAAVVTCPTAPTTLETLIEQRRDVGPLSERYPARLNEQALACLKSATLTFTAFVTAPEGLGGVVAYHLTPSWLDTWNDGDTYLAAS